ncbi:ISL3 family transposase [Paracoccus halophilus]|uniref:ISL3 family transposase n=1 Tax=Paracoccus halophilus TaxID=376733 RepID=UPI0006917B07
MVCDAREGELAAWLDAAKGSLIASFVRGLQSGYAAVAASLREPWPNGQTEGQINRLKTLKRQIYGRANIDLLRARLVTAS